MRLIVAGSRTIKISVHELESLLSLFDLIPDDSDPDRLELVSGGCPTGPDLAAKLSEDYLDVNYTEFPADWDKHGRAAGPIRNREMAEYSDCLLLIWDGVSRGSSNMKTEMARLKKPIYEVVIKKYN